MNLLILFILAIATFHLTRTGFISSFRDSLQLLGLRSSHAFWIYAIFMFPGVCLHEVSHWLAARVLAVRTHSFSLRPKHYPQGTSRLGYVEIGRTDPLRSSLIGAAPLVTGLTGVGLLAVFGLDTAGWVGLIEQQSWQALPGWLAIKFADPLAWIYLYLILVISNSMLPSEADRRSWRSVLFVAVTLSGILVGLNLTSTLLEGAAQIGESVSRGLTGVFISAAAVNGVGWVLFGLLRGGLRKIRRSSSQTRQPVP